MMFGPGCFGEYPHGLRQVLARRDVEQGKPAQQHRLEWGGQPGLIAEIDDMQRLLEDTLNLAWMDTERRFIDRFFPSWSDKTTTERVVKPLNTPSSSN